MLEVFFRAPSKEDTDKKLSQFVVRGEQMKQEEKEGGGLAVEVY